jgi:spore coat protein U-like protein
MRPSAPSDRRTRSRSRPDPVRCFCTLTLAAAIACTAPGADAACLVTGAELAFGVVDVSRDSSSTGRLQVDCDATTVFEVGLGQGSGQLGQRTLTGPGTARLVYGLYADAARVRPWGDGAAGGSRVTATGSSAQPVDLPIYGSIPSQPGTPPGQYIDSLIVTIIF